MKENESPKLLYLDQNQWVELEKVEYREKEDNEINEKKKIDITQEDK